MGIVGDQWHRPIKQYSQTRYNNSLAPIIIKLQGLRG